MVLFELFLFYPRFRVFSGCEEARALAPRFRAGAEGRVRGARGGEGGRHGGGHGCEGRKQSQQGEAQILLEM